MSLINTGDYGVVARSQGQTVLDYTRYGSYQGEWTILSKDDSNYYLYRGSYGSCSG